MTDATDDPKRTDLEAGVAGETREGATQGGAIQDGSWWEAALTRREAAQRAAVGVGGIALLLGASGLGVAACGKSDGELAEEELDRLEERDSIEVQKAVGWAAGDEEVPLKFATTTPALADSRSSADWQKYTAPAALLAATQPKTEAWAPFAVPTLFQALDQKTLADQMKPTRSTNVAEAYARGPALASLLTQTQDAGKTMLVVDLPGPEGVALAASMADKVEPVFVFDNWPHPRGVVPSQDTLGTTLFYAAELEKKKAERPADAPVALILDSQRLNPHQGEASGFDNRYVAHLPTPENLKERGIDRVVYVTREPTEQELDDLNDTMVAYDKADVKTANVALAAFQKDPNAPADSTTNGYYYGGSHGTHGGFYAHYPMFLFLPGPRWGMTPPSNVRRAQYRPAPRPTMFSARTTGGAAGVGRTKPTGFGRVSARVGPSGHVIGTRYGTSSRGTSGSYGRSRSSFGGG